MEIKKEWLEHAKVNEDKYSSMYDKIKILLYDVCKKKTKKSLS